MTSNQHASMTTGRHEPHEKPTFMSQARGGLELRVLHRNFRSCGCTAACPCVPITCRSTSMRGRWWSVCNRSHVSLTLTSLTCLPAGCYDGTR